MRHFFSGSIIDDNTEDVDNCYNEVGNDEDSCELDFFLSSLCKKL